ncbi:hypothetical protein [Alkaliphilus transvaalensis]|uniref:hypothetical protein n=1 Tax=Alkaliphilus transvaalensis TaxID=114628 RepID=UPI0004792495|nr:hypothetical protein [Alkaliphilus transvaalensis]
MKRYLIVIICIVMSMLILGCANKSIESFKEERYYLANKIFQLEEELSQKKDEIIDLKELNSRITKEKKELEDSLIMSKFSSYSRLNDKNMAFENLPNVYKINSKYKIKDDWYILEEEFFQLEVIGYETAKKVEFFLTRMESDQEELLIFVDNDPSDGWIYTNDRISEVIDRHIKASSGSISYEPYFILYTEVTLENYGTIQTTKLPVYYN